MKHLLPALASILVIACTSSPETAQQLKPRIIVMTDIGPAEVEPDDNESAVRLLSYADRFEIEGIITTVGWNCDPYPDDWAEYLTRVVDGYRSDVSNLMKRSGQDGFVTMEEENGSQALGYWPSADYIASRCVYGSRKAGIGEIGPGNDTDGSRLIIKVVDEAEDDRPVWCLAWGSGNTLAQAIWRVKQERSPRELKKFLNKLRLYTITDQDMVYAMRMNREYSSHMWLREEFSEDLMMIWDESAWLAQNENGKNDWESYARYIQGHGAMGDVYPHFLWGVEGDTPSFLHVMPNGLNDPDDPMQVGWGGYHEFAVSPDGRTHAWTNWMEPQRSISRNYENRFYRDEFNDFAARMQWAAEGKGDTNPVITLNGDTGIGIVNVEAKPGTSISLDASKSYDPEGEELSFFWEVQNFASYCPPSVSLGGENTPTLSVLIPEEASGCRYHVILTVHDDGPFRLPAYRRVIVSVE
ncbi:MAG: DUF1593 domain-containing protein [Bacteroidales bacterium]|nr:DUF1593 domain-containing protein [Bacteroidales bacterium]